MDDASFAAGEEVSGCCFDRSEEVSHRRCEISRAVRSANLCGSTNHIEQNLIELNKGPLPEDVLKALDEVGRKRGQ